VRRDRDSILEVLEKLDGVCLDNAREREHVAAVLHNELTRPDLRTKWRIYRALDGKWSFRFAVHSIERAIGIAIGMRDMMSDSPVAVVAVQANERVLVDLHFNGRHPPLDALGVPEPQTQTQTKGKGA